MICPVSLITPTRRNTKRAVTSKRSAVSDYNVIANQRRNAGVAIRNPCLPLGVVLRAAILNLTIASGNCSIM